MTARTYGKIMVDFGAVSADGLASGTGERVLMISGAELASLLDVVGGDGLRVLAHVIEHGDLRLNPPRIEVPGWKAQWIQSEVGLGKSAAATTARLLNDGGFIKKVYGKNGASGGAVGVLAGERFAWHKAVETVAGRNLIPGVEVTPQVNARFPKFQENGEMAQTNPVDNFDPTFSRISGERAERQDSMVDPTEDAISHSSAKRQVSALSQSPTSKESKESKSLLGDGGDAVVGADTLTRAALHTALTDRVFVASLEGHEDESIEMFSGIYSPYPERAMAALDFFGVGHGGVLDGQLLGRDVADWMVRMLLAPAEAVSQTAQLLRDSARRQNARIPKVSDRELVLQVVTVVALSMDTDVASWPAFLVSMMKKESYNESRGLSRLLAAVDGITHGRFDSGAVAGTGTRRKVAKAREGALQWRDAIGKSEPARPEPTVVDEEMALRGDGYLDWLRVIAEDTEFDRDSFHMIERSRKMQEIVINQHRRKLVKSSPDSLRED